MTGKRAGWSMVGLVGVAIALAGFGLWWWRWRSPAAPRHDEARDGGARDDEARDGGAEPVAIAIDPGRRPSVAMAVAAGVAASRGPGHAPDPARIVRLGDPSHPFGPGSAAPRPDGSGPTGWSIKGNADSGLYHTTSSPSWRRLRAEAWFETVEAAEAAGFTRWDWRRSAS